MRYRATMAQSSFRIEADDLNSALNALKSLTASNKSIRDGRLHDKDIALLEALEAFGWIVEVAPDGSICKIGYESDKIALKKSLPRLHRGSTTAPLSKWSAKIQSTGAGYFLRNPSNTSRQTLFGDNSPKKTIPGASSAPCPTNTPTERLWSNQTDRYRTCPSQDI